jgi:hypothetical protein
MLIILLAASFRDLAAYDPPRIGDLIIGIKNYQQKY